MLNFRGPKNLDFRVSGAFPGLLGFILESVGAQLRKRSYRHGAKHSPAFLKFRGPSGRKVILLKFRVIFASLLFQRRCFQSAVVELLLVHLELHFHFTEVV